MRELLVDENLRTELQRGRYQNLVFVLGFVFLAIFFLVRDGVYHPMSIVVSCVACLAFVVLFKVFRVEVVDVDISVETGFGPFTRKRVFRDGEMIVSVNEVKVPRNSCFVYELVIQDSQTHALVKHVFVDKEHAYDLMEVLRGRFGARGLTDG